MLLHLPSILIKYKKQLAALGSFFVLLTLALLIQITTNKNSQLNLPSKAAFIPNPLIPVRNAIIYEKPKWGQNGPLMTNAEVAARFSTVIYSRGQMSGTLSGYRSAGFNGTAMVYIVADQVRGPLNLASVTAQGKTCAENGITDSQRFVDVYTNTATMGMDGDLCEIHDAIVLHSCIDVDNDGSTNDDNVCPTENFFLHQSSGPFQGWRYVFRNWIPEDGSWTAYLPNPGDPAWQKYYSIKALREVVNIDPTHSAIANVDGVFVDNLALEWDRCFREASPIVNGAPLGIAPSEYVSSVAYRQAVKQFISVVYSKLHTNGNNIPVWGNLVYDRKDGSSWNEFDPYLDGGLMEPYGLAWGNPPSSVSLATRENEMNQADWWINHGNHFVALTLGNVNNDFSLFGFAQYLMITNEINASYKYAAYRTGYSYGEYYQLNGTILPNNISYPDYKVPLGKPLGAKVRISDNPRIYKRNFENGCVELDLTNYSGKINIPCTGSTPPTIPPTRPPTTPPTIPPTAVPTVPPSPAFPGTLNNTDSRIKYTGTWNLSSNRSTGDYNKDVHYTQSNSSYFEFTFSGTGIEMISERNTDQGSIDFYLDGVFIRTNSSYASTREAQQIIFSKTDLSSGTHTLKAVKKDGQYMLLDALRVVTIPANRIVSDSETVDYNRLVNYNGTWNFGTNNRGFGDYNNDVAYTSVNGAYFEYGFEGTGVEYITEKNSDMGDVDIYIDGVFQQTVKTYNISRLAAQSVYKKTGLVAGKHILKVVKKNGALMLLDALRVFYTAGTAPFKCSYNGSFRSAGTAGDPHMNPVDVAVDKSGNRYVVDQQNCQVRKYNASNILVSKWGSCGSGNGQLNKPWGVDVDDSGNIYVADELNDRIAKYTPSGSVTYWSTDNVKSEPSNPHGIAVTGSYVYVLDRDVASDATDGSNDTRIAKYDLSGRQLAEWGGKANGGAIMISNVSKDIDANSNYVYVVDKNITRIFTSSGVIVNDIFSKQNFSQPAENGVAVDSNGFVYVTSISVSPWQQGFWIYRPDGYYESRYIATAKGTATGQFDGSYGIAVDSANKVFVTDLTNHRIQYFSCN